MLDHSYVVLSRKLSEIWNPIPMWHSNLIISLGIGLLIHERWLFGLQAEMISHHVGYLSKPVNFLKSHILLMYGWLNKCLWLGLLCSELLDHHLRLVTQQLR
jgi:hypothetical protein